MTVTIDDLEDFMGKLEQTGMEKIKEKRLKKAIRHYWNVASKPTVNDRIDVLQEEGWISKDKRGSKWKLNFDKSDDIEKLFQ